MTTLDNAPGTTPANVAGADGPAGDASEALAERVFEGLLNTLETLCIHVGLRNGLYKVLAESPATPPELAERAGIHPRYAREWLEQQAAYGTVETDDLAAAPYERRFRLRAETVPVLVDAESPLNTVGAPMAAAGVARGLPALTAAFRTGDGVPYADYGDDLREGLSAFNRPMYVHELAGWLPALEGLHERLSAQGGRILDLGCGRGASSVALAQAYPLATIVGVDLDAASVQDARTVVAAAGVDDRVQLVEGDAAKVQAEGGFDLICLFEALHDTADPVGVLAQAAALLAPGGAVLVAEERVAEAFGGEGDAIERLNYAFSVLHCLPSTRAEGARVEAGTVLRPDVLRSYAEQAGLPTVTVLPIENPFWRFYRLDRP